MSEFGSENLTFGWRKRLSIFLGNVTKCMRSDVLLEFFDVLFLFGIRSFKFLDPMFEPSGNKGLHKAASSLILFCKGSTCDQDD